jgi:hypothetical protein
MEGCSRGRSEVQAPTEGRSLICVKIGPSPTNVHDGAHELIGQGYDPDKSELEDWLRSADSNREPCG